MRVSGRCKAVCTVFVVVLAVALMGSPIGVTSLGAQADEADAPQEQCQKESTAEGYEGGAKAKKDSGEERGLPWLAENERSFVQDVPLARQVLQAYHEIETYRATWRRTHSGSFGLFKGGKEFTTVFARDGRRTLFYYREYMEGEGGRPTTLTGNLIVHDGKQLLITEPALRDGIPTVDIKPSDPPHPFTYETFNRANRTPWSPWDLALLLSRTPLTDVLGGEPGRVEALGPDEQGRPGIKVIHTEGKDYVVLRLCPETKLVQSKVYVNTTEYNEDDAVPIELEAIVVDEPLDEDAFSAEPYVEQLRDLNRLNNDNE